MFHHSKFLVQYSIFVFCISNLVAARGSARLLTAKAGVYNKQAEHGVRVPVFALDKNEAGYSGTGAIPPPT